MTDINSLFKNDAKLKDVNREKYHQAPSNADFDATVAALKAANHNVIVVNTASEAVKAVEDLIAEGESVNTAGSATLQEIGFVDALKANKKKWRNVKEEILAEKDAAKQAELRRTVGASPSFHVTSVNAIDTAGTLYVSCLTGTRSGPFLFGPANVIVVAGHNKLVKDAAAAKDRHDNFSLPVESARVRVAYAAMGVQGSASNFTAEVRHSNPFSPEKRFTVVLVKQLLGF
jgi:hypothetical protein